MTNKINIVEKQPLVIYLLPYPWTILHILKATGAISLWEENSTGSTDHNRRRSDEESEDNWNSTCMYTYTYTHAQAVSDRHPESP